MISYQCPKRDINSSLQRPVRFSNIDCAFGVLSTVRVCLRPIFTILLTCVRNRTIIMIAAIIIVVVFTTTCTEEVVRTLAGGSREDFVLDINYDTRRRIVFVFGGTPPWQGCKGSHFEPMQGWTTFSIILKLQCWSRRVIVVSGFLLFLFRGNPVELGQLSASFNNVGAIKKRIVGTQINFSRVENARTSSLSSSSSSNTTMIDDLPSTVKSSLPFSTFPPLSAGCAFFDRTKPRVVSNSDVVLR